MKRSIPLMLALTIGCATGAVVRDIVAPARAQGQTGPSYEYDVVVVQEYWSETAKRKEILSKYGREGWRLASATQTGSNLAMLYFERQLMR
jgi:hypothetical protein